MSEREGEEDEEGQLVARDGRARRGRGDGRTFEEGCLCCGDKLELGVERGDRVELAEAGEAVVGVVGVQDGAQDRRQVDLLPHLRRRLVPVKVRASALGRRDKVREREEKGTHRSPRTSIT